MAVYCHEDGNPLNRLGVSTGTWSRLSKLSKSGILDELMTITSLKLSDINLLRFSTFRQGMNTYNNVEVTKNISRCIEHHYTGRQIDEKTMCKVYLAPLEEDLWKEDSSKPVTCTKHLRKVVPKSYGLKPAERNIHLALPSNIIEPFLELEGNNGEDTDEDEEYLPDLMPIQSGLWQLLTSQSFKLLEDITVEFKEYAPDKW